MILTKMPVDGFNRKSEKFRFIEELIQDYDEDSNKGYGGVQFPIKLHKLHSDLPFLSETMKIENCKKLVCNLYNTKNYVMQMTDNESWIETKANKQSDFFQSGSLAEATH